MSSKSKTERTAAQAWDYLSSAMAAAGEQGADITGQLAAKASKQGHRLAELAGDRGSAFAGIAGEKADVAWARANAAADALAGRKQGRPWGLIAGAALVGAALGFLAAGVVRATRQREAEAEEMELAENAVVINPAYDE